MVKPIGKSVSVSTSPARRIWILRVIVLFLGLAFGVPAFSAGALQPRGAWLMLKTAMPWAAGALLVLGPLAYFGRVKRRPRFGDRSTMESIRRLSRSELELVVRASFRLQGYAVEERETNESGDGVCAVLRKPGQKIVVRCVHHTGLIVGVEAVSELHRIMSSEMASGGLIVTCEEIGASAKAWVAEKPIGLIEGRALIELVNRGRARTGSEAMTLRREPHLGPPLPELLDCPQCGAPMVLGGGGQQIQAAASFFACSVARCPGTRPA
jgi:hypothetical protein